MKILIASATWMEVKLLADEMNLLKESNQTLKSFQFSGNEIDILITGIGTISATFRLTQVLIKNKYDLVINIGITGSFNYKLKIGEVVNVITEEFADWGIETKEGLLTLFESGYIGKNEFPFRDGILNASFFNNLESLKEVRGITANRSHGRNSTISEIKQKFPADIETMEGAAIFYVCISLGIPCCQIRAISNYVEPRDSSNWNIPFALENLKDKVLEVLKNILKF